ncbi:MAG: restriction endonuclease subunit S [Intestinibacter sp.]
MIEKVRLGELCRIQGGYAFKSNQFQKNNIPIIRIGNIQENKVLIDNDICYTKEFLNSHPEFEIKNGDLLIAMSGATVGKVGIYSSKESALLNQRVGKFVITDKIESRYLYFLLLSPLFEKFILNNAFGCAQPNISNKQIEEFKFNKYSIETQIEIANKLDKVQEIIDLRKKQTEELDELIKSQFVEIFGDPIENPKNNKIVKLSDIAEYWNGLTYKPTDVNKEGTIVLRSSNIQNSRLDYEDVVRVDCDIKEKLYVKDNDILMCSRNGSSRLVGKVAVIKDTLERMTFGAFMMIIRSEYYPYLFSYFQTDAFRNQIKSGATTTINQITGNMLNKIKLPLPDMKDIEKFTEFVKQVDKQKFLIEKSLKETKDLQESLMNKYFL